MLPWKKDQNFKAGIVVKSNGSEIYPFGQFKTFYFSTFKGH